MLAQIASSLLLPTHLEIIRQVIIAAPRRAEQALRLIARGGPLGVDGRSVRVVVVGVVLRRRLVLCGRSHRSKCCGLCLIYQSI